MSQSIVEHVNFTVSKPEEVANLLCEIFDWHIRWSGEALDNGTTIHVGSEDSYLAVYAHSDSYVLENRDHKLVGNFNHVGIVVDDLDEVERKVKDLGFKPFSHRDYEPGRRFYFLMSDDIEIEVISYQKPLVT